MTSKIKIIYNVGIIKIRGTLTGDDETEIVREIAGDLIKKGINKIVLDLSRVKWMDSCGLGMLMACFSSAQNANGKIGLAKVPDKIMEIMSITKVHTLFEHFDSVREAVKAYRS